MYSSWLLQSLQQSKLQTTEVLYLTKVKKVLTVWFSLIGCRFSEVSFHSRVCSVYSILMERRQRIVYQRYSHGKNTTKLSLRPPMFKTPQIHAHKQIIKTNSTNPPFFRLLTVYHDHCCATPTTNSITPSAATTVSLLSPAVHVGV